MQIRQAEVFNFGKLEKKKFEFAPGINVIYGANEAGKSTLHTFLVAMLFGLEKTRKRAGADTYTRYEPWHAPAYYSGALRFSVEGRQFYLERNFYHREKREILRNERDGEELSVAYGDLAMLLGGIGREAFEQTYDIAQAGALPGKELAAMLAEYLSDAAEGGNGTIRVTQAQNILSAKKKELNADLRKEQAKRQQKKESLRIEQELIEQDCRKLREDIARAAAVKPAKAGERTYEADAMTERGRESEKASHLCEKCRGISIPALLCMAGSVLGMLLNWRLLHQGIYREPVFWGAAGGLALLLLFGVIRHAKTNSDECRMTWKSKEAEKPVTPDRTADATDHTENTQNIDNTESAEEQQAWEQMYRLLTDNLGEKETRLYNITERLEALDVPADRERELALELEAVVMAESEIGRLARELGEEVEDELNGEVSRYVSAITDGKYDSVRVDRNGNLCVRTEGKEMPPDALSRGTLEQFYLALRLAVGTVITANEPMPIFLDEGFSMYDDKRLAQALKVLAGMPNQVLLFSCQKRELLLLEELGIPYHRIDL